MQKDPWFRRKQIFTTPNLLGKTGKKHKVKWRLLPILWLAFKKTSMVIGAVVIIGAVASGWMLSSLMSEINAVTVTKLPEQMVLHMKIEGDLPDLPVEASFTDPFTHSTKTLKNYIDALELASTDPRVKGIYANLGGSGLSVTHIQELRKAIEKFKQSGKFTYIYSTAFDKGIGGYYLASAFDEIWMQPMGVVMVSGINAEMPYLGELLDKVGVKPQIYKRKEYKGAYDMFTEKSMPKASREAMEALINDIADELKADISNDMGISGGKFKALVDKGLFMDSEALEAKLVDVVDYEDHLIEKINKQVTGDIKGDNLSYVNFGNYVTKMVEGNKAGIDNNKPKIAMIYALGAIVDSGGTSASVFLNDGIAAADEIAPVLLAVAEDESYDGVVLRIDSPGGSPGASETILHAVQKVRDAGKSVTVSMGPTAASGGYWIASYADQIFVLPTTITGSIGVIGGKFSLAELWDKLGVNWDQVSWGDNSAMWSMNKPYSKSEAERVNAMMDNVYSNFVERVAKGRDMTPEQVEKIARGRVWSGKRAIEIGLADQIGGLNEALDYAAIQVGGKSRADVNLVILPRPLTPLEQFIELLDEQVKAGEALKIQGELLKTILPDMRNFMASRKAQSGNTAIYDPTSLRVY